MFFFCFGSSKNKWYLFDDEAVTSIEDLNAPDRYDEEEATAAKKKTAKKNNNFPRNAAGEMQGLPSIESRKHV